MKDKYGNKLTIKEYLARWREGIDGITASQKLKAQQGGTRITLTGLFLGLAVSIYGWEKLWWVGIVLIGAIINTGVQYLGQRQQLNQLKKLENTEEVSIDELFEKHRVKDVKESKGGEHGN